jgi:hypothetical protein
MQDFILIAVPLLIVLYVSHDKLRRRIQSLEEQITGQNLAHQKLREANRSLQAELKRIECRIEPQDSHREPASPPVPEEEKPPLYRLVPDEQTKPPPLPDYLADLCGKMAAEPSPPVADQPAPDRDLEERSADAQEAHEPSLLRQIPWRDILGRMHLLPPDKSESGETAESQLAAWWVIRIGLVLLIIAAVFFGIHVSQHTPAWLRVLTLGLVSLGTIGLGTRMKGKLEGFGRAIIGGGFALLYFTAFAAFALPATKIIDSPTVGAMAQFSALVVAILWSLWKRDKTVATLTLFLGYVSCGFSHSHDLDRFATLGLVMLAATGAFLFATRGWLAPFITALVGSWTCFGIFALLDWLGGDSPAFLYLMGVLVALTVVFEAGNLVCVARGQHVPGDRLRRWLILSNTSAAAVLGYGVTRLAHPDQLSTFYFLFTALYFAFTVIHHLRTTDRAVTESLFLKSSALLCLGFAAAFTGPVRWLAIAFQAFALLWTARRSGSRWIAAGFVLVLTASIGWFWRDLTLDPPTQWRWLDSYRISGALYLVFLTAQLGFHSLWFPGGIGGAGRGHEKQARGFRLVAALVIGFSALALSLHPAFPGRSDPVWFLLVLSMLIGVLCPLMRKAVPCVAAALPLGSCYIAYAMLPPNTSQSAAAFLLGITLILTAFGLAEMIRRYWPESLSGGSLIREGALLVGLATLLPFSTALGRTLSLSGNSGLGMFVLFPVVACAAVICRQQATAHGKRSRLSIGFQIAVGVLVLMGGSVTCKSSPFFPSALALAGLPLLAMAIRIRIWNVVIAGALPILTGFFSLWLCLLETRISRLADDAINLGVLLLISISLAILLWEKIRMPRLRKATLWGDALLHALGIFSLHLFFQKHFGEGPDFFAAALLGVALYAVSRRFPFRVLVAISWMPVTLACFSRLLTVDPQGIGPVDVWFVASGLLVLAHLVIAHHLFRKAPHTGAEESAGKFAFGLAEAASCIAVLAWTLITFATTEIPWQAAVLTGVALLCSALWRWREIPLIGHLGLAPLTLAFCTATVSMLSVNESSKPAAWILTSILLTAGGLVANGMILASAVRRMGGKITPASLLPWFHAASALFLAFTACTLDRLVDEKLTAVFWGLSAILLFVSGLFAGLRAYRLTGLIGLVFCIGHIFVWDIQNTFHRIIAFFVIGLVLLVIGFLYNRFRERISAQDS